MATTDNASIYADQSTDANFRAWCQFIHDTFAASGGLVNTADTGQIDLATVLKPSSGSQSKGYKVYRLNDTLQATAPVFIKMEFGSASSALHPGTWLTVGTGSDGAGTVTGVLLNRLNLPSNGYSAASAQQCYGSVSTNRVNYGMFLSTASSAWWLSLERSKDSSGVDTAHGVACAYGYQGGNASSLYLPFSGPVPTPETGLQFILSSNNPAIYGTDSGMGVVAPMLGYPLNPGLNVGIINSNDASAFSVFNSSVYGASHAYRQCGSYISNLRSGRTDAATRLCLLHE